MCHVIRYGVVQYVIHDLCRQELPNFMYGMNTSNGNSHNHKSSIKHSF